MSLLFNRVSTKTRLALLTLAVGIFGLAIFQGLTHRSPEERAHGYYEHGLKLADQHDYAKAVIELRNALRLNNNMVTAWRKLAQVEEAVGHWDGVIESLQSILGLDPSDIEARMKLAKLLTLRGRLHQGLELTKTANEIDSKNAKILGLRAAILYKLNDKVEAVRQAHEALTIDTGNADALVVLANERMAAGDNESALKILESDTAKDVADIGVQLTKLKIYEQLGKLQNFESLLRALIKKYPQESALKKQLVMFYIGQHREVDAENEIRAMVEANRTNPETELELVRFLYATKGAAAAKQELVGRINAGGEVFSYQLALADLEYTLGDVVSAEQRVESLVHDAGSADKDAAAKNKLAEMYFKRNDIDAAEKLTSEILHADAHNTNALKLRGSIRLARGQLEPAVADLQKVLGDQPRSTEVMLLLALAYEQSGAIGRAEKLYADAVRDSSFNPVVGLNYAGFLLRRGSFERAEQFLSELSRRSPKNLDILSALAKLELTRKNWAAAQEVADLIRDAGDTHGIADQVRGAALIGQHKLGESISVFQGAFEASPTTVQPLVSLVTALVQTQRVDRAEAVLKTASQANPGNEVIQVLTGSVQLASGARDQALQSFKSAVEKHPMSVTGYLALAKFYVGEKKFDEALAVIRSGIQSLPDSVILRLELAGALEQDRQFDAAITEYEYILKKQPNSMIVANNLASLLTEHRNDKASLEQAQTLAIRLQESPVPYFNDTLGWVSYRRGDYIRAVSLLEKAATALPNIAMVRYHLAMSYIAIREPTKASEQLRAALLLAPDGELGEKIREALKRTDAS